MKVLKLFFVFQLLSLVSLAQSYTAVFEDGTKTDYEIFERHTDDANRFNIGLYQAYQDVSSSWVVSYNVPDKLYVQADYGALNAGVQGMVFFSSNEKNAKQKIT